MRGRRSVHCTSIATILRSHEVVVGERRLRVSERIAQSSSPAMGLGSGRLSITNCPEVEPEA